MKLLKLAAFDDEDLKILSSYVQDAVLKIGEIDHHGRKNQLALLMRRFVWENPSKGFFRRARHERRAAMLAFDRVIAIRSVGIDKTKPDEVLSLLAISFHPAEAPSGTIEIVFSGGATIQIDVECIEIRLSDLGGAWETASRPRHALGKA